MMKRGRPVRSQIRQNIVEILHFLGNGYGYQICKIYNEVFPVVTQRSIYYHLRKGLSTEEISINKIEQESGDFSWGPVAEKTYYSLGQRANPTGLARVRTFLDKWQK